jgi:2-polyprenyl-3-methyl-5-hydroxy-6-metoxy-1,4-benzoquinol methylase
MCLRDSIHGHILDVGGGDGMILSTILNQCKIESATFIDPMLNSGILLSGLKVQIFRGKYLNEVKEIQGKKFDLVLLVDVIHHVELADRVQLLSDCLALLSPTGNLVIKEISTRGFGSKIRYWGDVYISRDPVVSFVDQSDLNALLKKINPGLKIHTVDQYNKTDVPNYAISISH